MLSVFQLYGASRRKCKLLLSYCCAAGDLLNIFPFLSFADDASSGKDSQVPEGSNGEYEDHSGKQWGKEQCLFFWVSSVLGSVLFTRHVSQLLTERKGRVTGESSPYRWSNNKQNVSWTCRCEWIPSKGPSAKCSPWSALGPPAIYPSMVLPCICFSGQWLSFACAAIIAFIDSL